MIRINKMGVNMKTRMLLGGLAIAALATTSAWADMQANPKVNSRPGVASGPVTKTSTGNVTVSLTNSCYATNLRAVSNPVSPNSVITATIPLNIQNGNSAATTYKLTLKYPGAIVAAAGMTNPDGNMDPSTYSLDPAISGLTASIGGNMVEAQFPGRQINVSIDQFGSETDTNNTTITLGQLSFVQKMNDCDATGGGLGNTGALYGSWGWSTWIPSYPCGDHMGKDGPLTNTVQQQLVSSDSSLISLQVAFPGQVAFCGGFFSPLMLFFDDNRPSFTGESDFKLSASGKTKWVEPGAPGYFLALDRNGNGKIDGAEELFGNQDKDQNGFEALRELDSNHDGVIDAKDKMFKKLLLWNDKNGDGISQKEELEPLSKRVVKISLQYKGVHKDYGNNAQARQVGEFWYKDKGGKLKKGVIEDIWFAPITMMKKAK
jgi:hypothetical protein